MTGHIEWWVDRTRNGLYYRHVGCDTLHTRWIVPLDDMPLPDERGETSQECAHCCYVVPLKKAER